MALPPPTLSFTIPGAPVPKGRPRLGRGGRVFTPPATVAYENLVRLVANQAVARSGWQCIEGSYSVSLIVYRAAKRGDLDNVCKAVTDAANGILYPDDRMISHIELRRFDTDKKNPRVEVTVTRLDSP